MGIDNVFIFSVALVPLESTLDDSGRHITNLTSPTVVSRCGSFGLARDAEAENKPRGRGRCGELHDPAAP